MTVVEFGVPFGFGKVIQCFSNEGERVPILNGDGVQPSVVNTEPEGSILFLFKQDWGPGRGGACSDPSFHLRYARRHCAPARVARSGGCCA